MRWSQRNLRAFRLLLVIGLLGWLGRSFWLDPYFELGKGIRSAPGTRAWERRDDRGRRAPLPVAPAVPSLVGFAPEAVIVEVRPRDFQPSQIRITEVYYHPPSHGGQDEFVELTNSGAEPVSLAGWALRGGVRYLVPEGVVLAAKASVVICRDRDAFNRHFVEAAEPIGVFDGGLRNSGERLQLLDDAGKAQDDFVFRDTDPWPIEADGEGASLQLRDHLLDASDPLAWVGLVPSPGRHESASAADLKLSVFGVRHQPAKPGPDDTVVIGANVRGDLRGQRLQLRIEVGGEEHAFPLGEMLEGGIQETDGGFLVRAQLPRLPVGALVRYWFQLAEADDSSGRWPRGHAATPNFACFVSETDPEGLVPVYGLLMEPGDIRSLHEGHGGNQLVPATLVFDGVAYDRLSMRLRGAFARRWPKKAYKIFFNRDQLFGRRSRLNLNSGWRDPGMIREVLAYQIYGLVGAMTLQSRLVRVDLNGEFWGLYVEVEQPDKRYLEEQGLKDAALYKADSPRNQSDERGFDSDFEYTFHYRKETKEERPCTDLISFCRALQSPESRRQLFHDPEVRERFINYLCGTAITQNWDGFNKNHYIGFEAGDPMRWFFLPWDLDRTLGDHWSWLFDETRLSIWLGTSGNPGVTGWNRVFEAALSDPVFRGEYLTRLQQVLNEAFSEDWIQSGLAELERQMAGDASEDRRRWGGEQDWRRELGRIGEVLMERRRYLLKAVRLELGR